MFKDKRDWKHWEKIRHCQKRPKRFGEKKYRNEKYFHWHENKMDRLENRILTVERRIRELEDGSENYSGAAVREKEIEIMKERLRTWKIQWERPTDAWVP